MKGVRNRAKDGLVHKRKTTAAGRVVYNRKKHLFTLRDLERQAKKLGVYISSDPNDITFEGLVTYFLAYTRLRSTSSDAKAKGLPEITQDYEWEKGVVDDLMSIHVSAIIFSKGDEHLYALTAAL
jgi:hypothetical protein